MARHSTAQKLTVAQRKLARVSRQEDAETPRYLEANHAVIRAENANRRGAPRSR